MKFMRNEDIIRKFSTKLMHKNWLGPYFRTISITIWQSFNKIIKQKLSDIIYSAEKWRESEIAKPCKLNEN